MKIAMAPRPQADAAAKAPAKSANNEEKALTSNKNTVLCNETLGIKALYFFGHV